jgi:hypothetical protein
MARTVLTAQSVVRTGLEATYVAADTTNDHAFVNTGNEIIHMVNAGGGDSILTIDNPMVTDGINVPDVSITCTAGEERFIGPFLNSYEQDDTSQSTTVEDSILFSLDVGTSVTLALLQVSRPA